MTVCVRLEEHSHILVNYKHIRGWLLHHVIITFLTCPAVVFVLGGEVIKGQRDCWALADWSADPLLKTRQEHSKVPPRLSCHCKWPRCWRNSKSTVEETLKFLESKWTKTQREKCDDNVGCVFANSLPVRLGSPSRTTCHFVCQRSF